MGILTLVLNLRRYCRRPWRT